MAEAARRLLPELPPHVRRGAREGSAFPRSHAGSHAGSPWTRDALAGRLVELSSAGDGAPLTLAMALVLDAQRRRETVAWVTPRESAFFPPDVAASGVDLGALTVIRVPGPPADEAQQQGGPLARNRADLRASRGSCGEATQTTRTGDEGGTNRPGETSDLLTHPPEPASTAGGGAPRDADPNVSAFPAGASAPARSPGCFPRRPMQRTGQIGAGVCPAVRTYGCESAHDPDVGGGVDVGVGWSRNIGPGGAGFRGRQDSVAAQLASRAAARVADRLLRSGAFGLVVLDLGTGDLAMPIQARLVGLAERHDAAVVCLTEKPRSAPSLSSLVSLRLENRRRRTGDSRFVCTVESLKDKRQPPGWTHEEARHGPPGLR